MGTFIKPEIGKEYLIFEGGDNSFTGFYLGKKPSPTSRYSRILKPEGHIFIRSSDDKIEFYCTRDSKNKIQFWYHSDGDDGPEWDAGFSVQKVDIKLSESEFRELSTKLKKWESDKTAVNIESLVK